MRPPGLGIHTGTLKATCTAMLMGTTTGTTTGKAAMIIPTITPGIMGTVIPTGKAL